MLYFFYVLLLFLLRFHNTARVKTADRLIFGSSRFLSIRVFTQQQSEGGFHVKPAFIRSRR